MPNNCIPFVMLFCMEPVNIHSGKGKYGNGNNGPNHPNVKEKQVETLNKSHFLGFQNIKKRFRDLFQSGEV